MQTCIRIRLALALSIALGRSSMSAAADDSADRQAIESAAQQWVKAFNARDTASLAALATEDIVVLDGGVSPHEGAALASHVWVRTSALTRGGIKSSSKEIVVSGDAAWRVGALAYQRSGGEWHKGQSLEIWKRTRDGWKLHRQMSSHLMEQTLRPAPSEPVLDAPTH